MQDFLELRFALENTSSYLTYTSSTMSEWQFVSAIAERADVGLMFDVNNVYVSAYNHGFDPFAFIRQVPHQRIVQVHLAGHTNLGDYIIDTHSGPVIEPVLDLYRELISIAGPVSTLIEWDDEIPDFPVLAAEAERVRRVRDEGLALGAARRAGTAPPFVRPAWAARFDAPAAHGLERHPGGHKPWSQGGPREVAAE